MVWLPLSDACAAAEMPYFELLTLMIVGKIRARMRYGEEEVDAHDLRVWLIRHHRLPPWRRYRAPRATPFVLRAETAVRPETLKHLDYVLGLLGGG
jgi:hypothetical protein